MSRTTIKSFAIWAHEELLTLTKEQMILFQKREKEQLAEQVAYTWFHRLVALRYMEVNEYLTEAVLEGCRLPKVTAVDKGRGACLHLLQALCAVSDQKEAKKWLIAVCNGLHEWLPTLFPAVSAQTEALLSVKIFRQDGFVQRLLSEIAEEEWMDGVEIIGWLHQYYNTEQKGKAFGELQKSNVKISKERIPAATQLFTPDWIVHYMVDGALGGVWRDMKRSVAENIADTAMQKHPAYRSAEEGERLYARLTALRFLDPCMGSGHILVYAFEALMGMYRTCGVSDAQAVRLILQNNLFGMDIDQRAAQLSGFSLMMKARQYDAHILEEGIRPHVYVVSDSRFLTPQLIDFAAQDSLEIKCDLMTLAEDLYDAAEYGSLTALRPIDLQALSVRAETIAGAYYGDVVEALYAQQVKEKLLPLIRQAEMMAQQYDAVVTNPPYMGKSAMDKKLRDYVKKQYPLSNHDLFAVFIEKCDAMLAEGGYLGMITQHSWMFLKSYEKLRRRILSSRTIIHMLHLGTRAFEEISGEVVQTVSWIMQKTEEPKQSGTYVRLVDYGNDKERIYEEEKETGRHQITYVKSNADFFRIPGAPVAYWVPEKAMPLFETTTVADFAVVTNGMFTCSNRRFLRLWYEVPREEIAFGCASKYDCIAGGKKWFPYNKGGNFCRWYGNHEYVIDFENFGEEIRNYRIQSGQSAVFPGQEHYFEPSLSWSLVSPNKFGIRYYPQGFVFDIAGSSIFPVRQEQMMPMLAVLASEPTLSLLKVLNPTINYQAGDIRSLPMLAGCLENAELGALAEENVRIAKELWDSRETSWEFETHPIVRTAKQMREESDAGGILDGKGGNAAADSSNAGEVSDEKRGTAAGKAVLLADCVKRVLHKEEGLRKRLAANEARINEIVSAAYGFGETAFADAAADLEPERENRTGEEKAAETGNVTVSMAKAAGAKEAALCKELLSYAVGCMFGRYESASAPTDGCLLYLTEEDFIARLRALIAEWFGEKTLTENLCFAAACLNGKKGEPQKDGKGTALQEKGTFLCAQERILAYMQKDFYKEHERMYRKHPIYWQMKTPAKSGLLPALLYMHRFEPEQIREYWHGNGEIPVLNPELGTDENRRRLAGVLRS